MAKKQKADFTFGANKRVTQIGLHRLQHKQWAALSESNSGLGGITAFYSNGGQTMPFITERHCLWVLAVNTSLSTSS